MKTKQTTPKSSQRGSNKRSALKQRRRFSAAAIVRFEKRKAVVAAVQRGEAISAVARLFHVPERTVFRWLSWYRDKGWDGLRDDKRSGRPRKVSPEVIKWIYQIVTGGTPQQLQFEFALWTLNLIRAALRKYQNIELSKSSVCRLMAQLGLSPQVPVYRSYRRNPGKISYYLKTRYPKLVALAKKMGAEIFFADESRARADGHQGTTWAPIGQTPEIEDSGDRFGVNMMSAVSARGAMFFQCFEGKMHSDRFISFLKDLRRDAGRPIIVIVDGGSYHTSRRIKAFIKTEGKALGIGLAQLPPYCPELNPDEQVWNQAKKKIGKMYIATKKDLADAAEKALAFIQRSVDLIKSFFLLKDTRYANLDGY